MVTENVLILCAYYTDSNNANGVCSKNLAEEFVRRRKNVWVLSSSDEHIEGTQEINGVKVQFVEVEDYVLKLREFRKNKSFFSKMRYIFFRLKRNITLLWNYPNNSPSRAERVKRLAEKMIEENGIDTLIGTYRPFESIYACTKLKNRYKEKLKVITYHLDLLSINDEWKGIATKIMHKKAKYVLQRETKLVDGVLIPENYFVRLEARQEKWLDVGFPLYIKKTEAEDSGVVFDEKELSIVYIGSLDKDNRNPISAVEMISRLSKIINIPVKIHIWGRLWDAETCEILESSEIVKYHGSIDNRYVQDVLQKSDCLLNISNKVTYRFLPSKIFQYFALGKPIVNIVQNREDCSMSYFEKYNSSLNIYTDVSYEEQTDSLLNFLRKVKVSQRSDEKLITSGFEKFTPAYICKIIENISC